MRINIPKSEIPKDFVRIPYKGINISVYIDPHGKWVFGARFCSIGGGYYCPTCWGVNYIREKNREALSKISSVGYGASRTVYNDWQYLSPYTQTRFVQKKIVAIGERGYKKLNEKDIVCIQRHWGLFSKTTCRLIHRTFDRAKLEGKAKSIYFEKIGKQLPKKPKSPRPSKKPSGTVSITPSAPASKTASGKPSKKHVHPRTGKSPTQTRKTQKPSPYVIHPPPPLHLPTYKK